MSLVNGIVVSPDCYLVTFLQIGFPGLQLSSQLQFITIGNASALENDYDVTNFRIKKIDQNYIKERYAGWKFLQQMQLKLDEKKKASRKCQFVIMDIHICKR